MQKAVDVAQAAKVTYLESQLTRSLLKTDLSASRESILKYKGKCDSDVYDQVLEQLRAGCDSALSDLLSSEHSSEKAEKAEKHKPKDQDEPPAKRKKAGK